MGFIRKPTFVALSVTVVLVLFYGMARHNLYSLCPKMEYVPVFSLPAGFDDLDDGLTFQACTDQDVNYLEMQKYGYYAEGCGLIVIALLAFDWAAFAVSKRHKRGGRQPSNGKHWSRKYLSKLSRFLGGL